MALSVLCQQTTQMQTKPGRSHGITAPDLIVLSGHKPAQIQWRETQPSMGGGSTMCSSILKLPQAPASPVKAKVCGEKEWAARDHRRLGYPFFNFR